MSLINIVRRLLARLRFGTELAVDPQFARLVVAERAELRRHGRVKPIREAKTHLLHEALRRVA